MGRKVKTSTSVNLTLTLEKTQTGKYPQAVVFSTTGSVIDTVNLDEVDSSSYAGLYQGVWTTPSTQQDCYVTYVVYTDTLHSLVDTGQDYNAIDEYFVEGASEGLAGAGSFSHTDTILDEDTNNPVEGANIYIYSDSGRSQLIASTSTAADGTYLSTLYADSAGPFYRTIVSSGRAVYQDTVTFT